MFGEDNEVKDEHRQSFYSLIHWLRACGAQPTPAALCSALQPGCMDTSVLLCCSIYLFIYFYLLAFPLYIYHYYTNYCCFGLKKKATPALKWRVGNSEISVMG